MVLDPDLQVGRSACYERSDVAFIGADLGGDADPFQIERLSRRDSFLLTPEAVPAILPLPVVDQDNQPESELNEMVRWELEPVVAQYFGSWM